MLWKMLWKSVPSTCLNRSLHLLVRHNCLWGPIDRVHPHLSQIVDSHLGMHDGDSDEYDPNITACHTPKVVAELTNLKDLLKAHSVSIIPATSGPRESSASARLFWRRRQARAPSSRVTKMLGIIQTPVCSVGEETKASLASVYILATIKPVCSAGEDWLTDLKSAPRCKPSWTDHSVTTVKILSYYSPNSKEYLVLCVFSFSLTTANLAIIH